jgi:sulfite exporter TauE/SafE
MTELALSAFLVGLLGGGHCVAMCGGIVGALNLGARPPAPAAAIGGGVAVADGGAGAQFTLHAAYGAGRIGSYAVAGAIAGGVGGTALLVDSVLPAQLALAVVANALLVLLGLYLAGHGVLVARLEAPGGWLWRRIAPLGRRFVPADTPARALGVGAVWGWLPCGLVYSVLAMALVSGDASRGAAVMLAFGLGTAPNLLAAGFAVGRLRAVLGQPRARLAAGLAVVALGILGAARTPGLVEQVKRGLACLA